MPILLATPQSSPPSHGAEALEIGLLNNLSDAGLEGGERQFIDLLRKAAGARLVRLHLLSMPEIERGTAARTRIAERYMPFETLFDRRLDGLIVTGCEPHAPRLQDEPYWSRLTEIIDWADAKVGSTIFSCLAAHAAVLHLHGIERRRAAAKISGVFPVEPASQHPLLAGAATQLQVPHSRYNDLAERDLVAAGYEILTRSPTIGVDAFVREGRSTFVFLQGHPEYDADALYREYRRDVLRFLDGSSENYPDIPIGAVSDELKAALESFATLARCDRRLERFSSFPLGTHFAPPPRWNDELAFRLFANWLETLPAKTVEHA